jgi:adenosylcobinamide amidohydrolase
MKLQTFYDGVEVHRAKRILYLRFLQPHRVISSSRGGCGGMCDTLEYLYNHQCCEPTGHHFELYHVAVNDPHRYQDLICAQHDLPADRCAELGTAANMNNAAIVHREFHDVQVVALVTGGLETNAARAGDPAAYHRGCLLDGRKTGVHGTINTMVCINCELTAGALVQAVITATEAKTAVLQELAIPSRYSDGYATGTGTDQIGIAAMRCGSSIADAGKHSKTGELIGITVKEALRGTLRLQNGLYPERQCSVLRRIERLGIDEGAMRRRIAELLDRENSDLFEKNFLSIDRDPPTVAAVSALLHIRDQCVWGVLPKSCFAEMVIPYAVDLASAVSGDGRHRDAVRERLFESPPDFSNEGVLDLICRAVALGFEHKWGSVS